MGIQIHDTVKMRLPKVEGHNRKRLTVTLERGEREALTHHCDRLGVTANDLIRSMIVELIRKLQEQEIEETDHFMKRLQWEVQNWLKEKQDE